MPRHLPGLADPWTQTPRRHRRARESRDRWIRTAPTYRLVHFWWSSRAAANASRARQSRRRGEFLLCPAPVRLDRTCGGKRLHSCWLPLFGGELHDVIEHELLSIPSIDEMALAAFGTVLTHFVGVNWKLCTSRPSFSTRFM